MAELRRPFSLPGMLAAGIGLGLLVYAGWRAQVLSLTHDEALSYLQCIAQGRLMLLDSNTHLLNSLSMQFWHWLLGPEHLALRLSSVLALGLYLVCAWRIALRLRPDAPQGGAVLAAVVLLGLQPYLLDFFSLARGYGLALAFMLAAVLLLLRGALAPPRRKPWELMGAAVLASLAVAANYAFIIFYAALLATALLWEYLRRRKVDRQWGRMLHRLTPMLAYTFFALGLALLQVLRLQEGGGLYFGGQQGFYQDTVLSLVRTFFYATTPFSPWEHLLGLAVCAVALAMLFGSLRELRRTGVLSLSGLLTVLLWLTVLGSQGAHYLLAAPYLQGRFALMYVPLFVLALLGWLLREMPRGRGRSLRSLLTAVLLVLFSFNFLWNANFMHCLNWRYDACTRELVDEVERLHAAEPQAPLRLAAWWAVTPAINAYRHMRHLEWLNELRRNFPPGGSEEPLAPGHTHFYVPLHQAELIPTPADSLEVLRRFPHCNMVLVRDTSW